jgi:streptogramin lyase
MSPTSPTIAIVLCLATLALPAARAEDTSAPTGSVESITLQSEVPLAADYVNFGALWMMPGRGLVRIDAADGSVMKIPVEGATGRVRALAIDEGAVWIADVGSKTIYKIDPIAKAVALRIPGEIYGVAGSIGAGDGDVWAVTDSDRVLTRFDARDGRMRVPLPGDSAGVAVAFWSIWVADNLRNELIGSIRGPRRSLL